MRKVNIELYQFKELSEEAQKRVIENMQEDDSFLMYDWYSWVYDEFKSKMYQKYMCNVNDIYFTGFWSQGDGASFSGYVIIEEYLKATKQISKYANLRKYLEQYTPSVDIRQSGNYYHSNTMSFYDEDFTEATEKQQDQLYKIMDEIEEVMKQEADDLYRELEQEYEYQTSDEAIAEQLINAEYEFYADGRQPNF